MVEVWESRESAEAVCGSGLLQEATPSLKERNGYRNGTRERTWDARVGYTSWVNSASYNLARPFECPGLRHSLDGDSRFLIARRAQA